MVDLVNEIDGRGTRHRTFFFDFWVFCVPARITYVQDHQILALELLVYLYSTTSPHPTENSRQYPMTVMQLRKLEILVCTYYIGQG